MRAEGVGTPDYDYQVRGSSRSDGRREWLVLTCEYDLAAEWTDEIRFNYYVVLEGRPDDLPEGAEPRNLFAGNVSYVHVKRGQHQSTMFLDPNTFERYGSKDIVATAVVVEINGEEAGTIVEPASSAQSGWWKAKSPLSTPLLRRDESPWKFVEIEAHNTIKP